ncbi:MAG: hypothetical protein AAGE03_13100 [Pseudomonadota bacterium]
MGDGPGDWLTGSHASTSVADIDWESEAVQSAALNGLGWSGKPKDKSVLGSVHWGATAGRSPPVDWGLCGVVDMRLAVDLLSRSSSSSCCGVWLLSALLRDGSDCPDGDAVEVGVGSVVPLKDEVAEGRDDDVDPLDRDGVFRWSTPRGSCPPSAFHEPSGADERDEARSSATESSPFISSAAELEDETEDPPPMSNMSASAAVMCVRPA